MSSAALAMGDPRPATSPGGRLVARAGVALGAAVCVASGGVLLATGDPVMAGIPLAVAAIALAVWTLPLRYTAYAVIGLTMIADIDPRKFPGNEPGTWVPPTRTLQLLLLENLNKLTGIEALRFAGVEVLVLALLAVAVVRDQAGRPRAEGPRVRMPAPLAAALWLALGAVLWMELLGIARGGDVRQSLWQLRQLLWLPVIAAFCAYAFRGTRDFIGLARALAATACIKIAIGLMFYILVARPQRVQLNTVTSHDDTILFVSVLASVTALVVYRARLYRLIVAVPVAAWTLFGIFINNRRTAYVSLFATVMMLYAVLPPRRRRFVHRAMVCALPLFLVYLVAGRNRREGIWAPAAAVHSVIRQKDASSATRDIENYNLIKTWRQNPLLGSGWGHEYLELSRAFDISSVFAQYRFVAHNSVLWLFSLGGLVGFTLLWLPSVVGVYLAARSYHLARGPEDAYAAYTVLSVYAAYAVQAWADMGTQSWTGTFLLAAALVFSGKLATLTGAWPADARLFAGESRTPGLTARGGGA